MFNVNPLVILALSGWAGEFVILRKILVVTNLMFIVKLRTLRRPVFPFVRRFVSRKEKQRNNPPARAEKDNGTLVDNVVRLTLIAAAKVELEWFALEKSAFQTTPQHAAGILISIGTIKT
ncbi:hypothetical protein A2721_02255 [Candidatus Gottesmanbacteria bacterium RIFCSPHIGHO2_01_FULL_47_48]|uniref:Uncharacterized protein n=1 Tax=Candidatus Gottesmanbacteria bacterium RIFCSPHIGHO2_01_FULL_47_48 TaxID=1798381 RepID=A0A1F6A0C1_9BACT|nr:MAG: hypothetical protein A2721_02255 [Candidatus Gottesmanbacteria bacterium RIFCSPHIGHO2_01_FULL_47_48]